MIDREEAHRLSDDLIDAVEREQSANSDEGRAKAQVEVLAAADALGRANGVTSLHRRRMVVDARSLSSGSRVEPGDFEQLERDCVDVTPEGQVRLRQALARHVLDTANVLTLRMAGLQAANMLQNAKGRDGPLDGRLMVSGVDPGLGAADELRNKIVADTGYTVGVEIGATGRIQRAMWKRAAWAQNSLAAKLRMMGLRVLQDMSAATIKDLCLKETRMAALFRDAKREGAAAHADPDPGRLLPTQNKKSDV